MQAKKTTKEIGDECEHKAKLFLEEKGYKCIAQNYRSGRNEIDLIFEFANKLIFVEVKFRFNKKYGNPEEFVSKAQLKRVKLAAENYLYQVNWQKNIRFDVVALTPYELVHFEDV